MVPNGPTLRPIFIAIELQSAADIIRASPNKDGAPCGVSAHCVLRPGRISKFSDKHTMLPVSCCAVEAEDWPTCDNRAHLVLH